MNKTIMDDNRNKWKGWSELPTAKEGNTGKYPNYQNLLFNMLQETKPKNILEIGFNAGHSACCFLNASPDANMITFDICRWGTELLALEVLKKYFNIKLIKGDSTETVPAFFEENDIKFDLVFIDGYHGYDPSIKKNVPYEDMMNVKHAINPGGIIIIDDMGVGTVTECYRKVDWTGFERVEFNNKIEKDIVILKKTL